jgi:hypothetical protein
MLEEQGVRFVVEAGRVSTDGFGRIGHPDLTMRASSAAEVEAARATLLRLAAMIVSCGTRLRAGDTVVVDDRELTLGFAGRYLLEVAPASSGDSHNGPGSDNVDKAV